MRYPRVVQPAAPAHQSRWRQRRGRSFARRALLTAGVLLSGVCLVEAGVDRAYQNRVLPGVRQGAVSLAGLTQPQASGVLDVYASTLLASPAVFTFDEHEWHPTAAEIGLSIDTAGMARDAVAYGRAVPGIFRLPHAFAMERERPELPLRTAIDKAQLGAFLSAVAAEVDRTPIDAALAVKDGQLVAEPSAAGQKVDIAATVERVRLPLTLEDVQRVEVVVAPVAPEMSEANVSEAQAAAAKILAAPLTLHAGSRTWTLSPAALGNLLDIKKAAGDAGQQLVATLDEAKLAAYVKTLAAAFDRPPVNAQLRWSGGGVTVVRDSQDGAKLDQAAAVKAIVRQASQQDRDVTLPIVVSRPVVAGDAIAQLGITSLLSTGTSKFAGSSPERANNIQVAANRLNGTVILAGATFSFLAALGPITVENGYKEGLTIQGDATVPGIGGGVCQVSTTAFRAAFFAGLPIVERHQHTYRVGYYEQDGSPVGFDAAVYDPGVDFRFKNDTGAAMLIQTSVDAASATLTFRFYGTPTGRDVKLVPSKGNEVKAGAPLPDGTDPTLPKGTRKQVEWPADGVDATIRRTVTRNGQTPADDSFFSRYTPWREKWVVGTKG